MSIKIMTDSASNLNTVHLSKYNIEMLSFEYRIGQDKYKCFSLENDKPEFYQKYYDSMRNKQFPETSLVSPGIYQEAFEKELENGNDVIYIALSSGVSGTYQCAKMVAEQLAEEYPNNKVYVIDSKTASFGEGILAIRAYELAEKGIDPETIVNEITELSKKIRSEFVVNDLNFLARTGRIKGIVAKIGNVLSIKPLLKGDDNGHIVQSGKTHGKLLALMKLASQVYEHMNKENGQTIYIAHCDCENEAQKLKFELEKLGVKNPIEIHYYDLCTGAHVGPGTIAIFYEGFNR